MNQKNMIGSRVLSEGSLSDKPTDMELFDDSQRRLHQLQHAVTQIRLEHQLQEQEQRNALLLDNATTLADQLLTHAHLFLLSHWITPEPQHSALLDVEAVDATIDANRRRLSFWRATPQFSYVYSTSRSLPLQCTYTLQLVEQLQTHRQQQQHPTPSILFRPFSLDVCDSLFMPQIGDAAVQFTHCTVSPVSMESLFQQDRLPAFFSELQQRLLLTCGGLLVVAFRSPVINLQRPRQELFAGLATLNGLQPLCEWPPALDQCFSLVDRVMKLPFRHLNTLPIENQTVASLLSEYVFSVWHRVY